MMNRSSKTGRGDFGILKVFCLLFLASQPCAGNTREKVHSFLEQTQGSWTPGEAAAEQTQGQLRTLRDTGSRIFDPFIYAAEDDAVQVDDARDKRRLGSALNVKYKTWNYKQPVDKRHLGAALRLGANFRPDNTFYHNDKRYNMYDNYLSKRHIGSVMRSMNRYNNSRTGYKRAHVNALESLYSIPKSDNDINLNAVLESLYKYKPNHLESAANSASELGSPFQDIPDDTEYELFAKRHIGSALEFGSLVRGYHFPPMRHTRAANEHDDAKQHVASLLEMARSGQSKPLVSHEDDIFDKRHLGSALEFGKNLKRHIGAAVDFGKHNSWGAERFSEEYKRHIGSALDYGEKNKRHLGPALGFGRVDLGETVKRHIGSALDFGKEDERHIASALQFGKEDKRHIGAALGFGKEDIRDIGAALSFGKEDKRHIGSALEFGKKEKRHIGSAMEFGKEGKRHIGAALEFGKEDERHIGSALELGKEGKRHIGAALEFGKEGKRHIGSALEFGKEGKRHIGSALEFGKEDKRHIGAALEFGKYGKRHIGAALDVGKEDKRHIGSAMEFGKWNTKRHVGSAVNIGRWQNTISKK